MLFTFATPMVGADQASTSTTSHTGQKPLRRIRIHPRHHGLAHGEHDAIARATEAARAIATTKTESDHFADQKRITTIIPSSAGCERARSPTNV